MIHIHALTQPIKINKPDHAAHQMLNQMLLQYADAEDELGHRVIVYPWWYKNKIIPVVASDSEHLGWDNVAENVLTPNSKSIAYEPHAHEIMCDLTFLYSAGIPELLLDNRVTVETHTIEQPQLEGLDGFYYVSHFRQIQHKHLKPVSFSQIMRIHNATSYN